MNGFCTAFFSYINDGIDAQVALRSWGRSDEICFVGFAHVTCMTVSFRVDSHGTYAHLTARCHDADSDLASVGDENLSEHVLLPQSHLVSSEGVTQFGFRFSRNARNPSCPSSLTRRR